LAQYLEVATEHVMGLARRDHPPADVAAVARHPDDDPQLGGLAEADRYLHVGLPQIELGQLARAIGRALAGVGGHKQRP